MRNMHSQIRLYAKLCVFLEGYIDVTNVIWHTVIRNNATLLQYQNIANIHIICRVLCVTWALHGCYKEQMLWLCDGR